MSAGLVLVTVGSDHHPFPRIVQWADDYVAAQPCGAVEFVCQHGTADAPSAGLAHAFVEHDTLQALMQRATAVVCHGGPSTVLECLRLGRLPIVVPRRCHLGEVVDDHQLEFSRFLARREQVVLVETRDQLHAALDRALLAPDEFRAPAAPAGSVSCDAAVQQFSDFARRLTPSRRGRLLRKLA